MNTNKLLLIIAVTSVLLAIILIPMIIFKPWIPVDPLYVSGKVFYLRVTEPLVSDEIIFSGNSQSGELTTFRIKPENPNNKLAKVDVELTNHSNSTVKILIDSKSTELITNKQDFFKPLDSVEKSEAIDNYDSSDLIEFTPLWGSFDLFPNEKIKGSFAFEIPTNIVFVQFAWLASDSITIAYTE
ncbi:MAG: hypothetical protein QF496_01215 [Dehalococcoidia bacterium]|jgi:hypothetical protein|nr:hypothetical protein [Dehalococcoidia bacterium]